MVQNKHIRSNYNAVCVKQSVFYNHKIKDFGEQNKTNHFLLKKLHRVEPEHY